MLELIRRDFLSWAQEGESVRAVALSDGDWFEEAINCMRDSDMGTLGEDGVYSRIWYGDPLRICGAYDIRPATSDEVEKYLAHCSVEWFGEKVFAIVRGEQSYVLYIK